MVPRRNYAHKVCISTTNWDSWIIILLVCCSGRMFTCFKSTQNLGSVLWGSAPSCWRRCATRTTRMVEAHNFTYLEVVFLYKWHWWGVQGFLSVFVFSSALGLAQGTFVDLDIDLGALKNSTSILKALLKGKECVSNYDRCPSQLAVISDPADPACFYICSGKGGACNACCDPGYVFQPPSSQAAFGTCSKM
jgi:hypothetical protein